MPLPVVVTGEQNRGGARMRIVGREAAAHDRLDAQYFEEIARDPGYCGPRRLRSSGNAHRPAMVFRHCLEAVALVAEIDEVRVSQACKYAAMIDLPYRYDAIRLRIRQRPQQHAVNHAEDCRRRADAKRQRQNGDGVDAGILAQPPSGILQVLEQRMEHDWPSLYSAQRPWFTVSLDRNAGSGPRLN